MIYSISSLQLHKKNPRRWCLRYLENIKDKPTSAMDLGINVHFYLQQFIKYKGMHPKWLGITNYYDVSLNAIKDILTQYGQQNWRTEYKFEIPIMFRSPDIEYNGIGIVDLWRRYKDTLIIFDHKVVNPTYAIRELELIENWQLNFYAYGLIKSLNWEPKDILIGQCQFQKNRQQEIEGYKIINSWLPKNIHVDIIMDIKREILKADKTAQIYRTWGLNAVRDTPENRYWYGRPDELWDVISGKMSVQEYKKLYAEIN